MYAVGLMSGTSLDGIDAALCEIHGHGFETKIRLIDFITYPLNQDLEKKIRQACFKETSSVDLLCSLNFELGQAFSEAVSAVLDKAGMTSADLDFVASHGQTVYHQPFADKDHIPSTLQIGEPAVIAYQHHCPVVSNFRVMDMAAGGQGAPLVPYSEWILYAKKDKKIVLLNIGGIGNLTWLDGSLEMENMLAFDTGPGNMMINAAMKHLYQKSYDHDGQIAGQGKLIASLFEVLRNDEYIQLAPPKSTGREHFGEDAVVALLERFKTEKPQDLVYTFTYFTAYCVAYHIQRYLETPDELIVGGGGAHNPVIMRLLEEMLSKTKVMSQDALGNNADAKEAMAFVVMGHETLAGLPSNVPSATGAKEAVVLGTITPWLKKGVE